MSFFFVFRVSVGSRNWFLNTGVFVLRRRVIAGLDEESSDVSCGNDVRDVLALELEEPVDDPWDNDWHIVFRVELGVSAIWCKMWFLTTGPLI